MGAVVWVLVALVILVVLGAAAWSYSRKQRTERLRGQFGPEYDRAVQHLVAETMKRLAETFANARNNLENQWSQGDQAGTEELRVALRRYRAFFDRLLAI